MTTNQIAYQELQRKALADEETKRANLVKEMETMRANQASEQIKLGTLIQDAYDKQAQRDNDLLKQWYANLGNAAAKIPFGIGALASMPSSIGNTIDNAGLTSNNLKFTVDDQGNLRVVPGSINYSFGATNN